MINIFESLFRGFTHHYSFISEDKGEMLSSFSFLLLINFLGLYKIKSDYIRQGKVSKSYDDQIIETSNKVSLQVTSEIQCVHRCLVKSGCNLMNYAFKDKGW